MKGIDIASYQQNVDFVKVKKSGIEIAYIKATEGITYNNPLLEQQYRDIRSKTFFKFYRWTPSSL